MMLIRICAFAAAFVMTAHGALAQPVPKPRPAPDPVSQTMDEIGFQTLRRVFDAIEVGQFKEARSLMSTLSDEDAQTLAWWRLARERNADLSDAELAMLLKRLEGWPSQDRVQSKLEEAFFLHGSDTAAMEAALGDRDPVSGDGMVARALILKASGDMDGAQAMAREAWTTRRLSTSASSNLRRNFQFTREETYQRADLLVWLSQWTEASSLLGQLESGQRSLMRARMTIARGHRGADTALAAVPSRYAEDPGLLYARTLFKRRRGDRAGALDVIQRAGAPDSETGAEVMWTERRIQLRRALADGEPGVAYSIASRHGLEQGVEFAEASFLAGWIALRKLDDPAAASRHFDALSKGVSTPVSLARANYWRGRTADALNQTALAEEAYASAAAQGAVFYALLARDRLGMDLPDLTGDNFLVPDADEAAFRELGSVRALVLLGELGQRYLFRQFAYGMADLVQAPQELEWISDIARDQLEPSVGVRLAKSGQRRGWLIPDALYPIAFDDPRVAGVERALPLAIARQESEFDPFAISSARAYGMMQMIDSTARMTARRHGVSYDRAKLLADPEYNIRLGASHLADLMESYDGNVAMVAAAYNAGGGRVSQWVRAYGDPRSSNIDPIDWMESIPISETNNYVQRVLENLIVYRIRLGETPDPRRLSAEINQSRYALGGP